MLGMNSAQKSIVLIGMMGAGKSFVGRSLHRRTGLAIWDTDEMVASSFAMSIPEIFLRHSEKKFREAETAALQALAVARPAIIATGGGMLLREKNVEILKRVGVIVWLDGDKETLFARASRRQDRPLLQAKNPSKAFSQMLASRRPLYANSADIRIDTSVLTDEEVAVAILAKLRRMNPKTESPISATAS